MTASWVRKYLLSRAAASSIAAVVRCRSPEPNSRIIRSRRSSRCIRMNTATSSTMPMVASGDRIGDSTRVAISIGVGSGWCTSTGTGFGASEGGLAGLGAGGGAAGGAIWLPSVPVIAVIRPMV